MCTRNGASIVLDPAGPTSLCGPSQGLPSTGTITYLPQRAKVKHFLSGCDSVTLYFWALRWSGFHRAHSGDAVSLGPAHLRGGPWSGLPSRGSGGHTRPEAPGFEPCSRATTVGPAKLAHPCLTQFLQTCRGSHPQATGKVADTRVTSGVLIWAFKRFADEAHSAKLFAVAPADPPPRSPGRGQTGTPTVAGSQVPAVERRSPAGPGAIRLQSPGLCRACPGLVPGSLQPPWRGPWVPPHIRPPSFLPSRPHPAVLTPRCAHTPSWDASSRARVWAHLAVIRIRSPAPPSPPSTYC